MSEIKVDTLTGKTSAGDITVTSEGGAATMQLQQGLAKAWVNLNGTGTIAVRDSNNVTSLADGGSGDVTINFSNAMSNANYASVGNCDTNNAYTVQFVSMFNNPTGNTDAAPTTTAFRLGTRESAGSGRDEDYVLVSTHGDLA
jgi:hypothetical protein